MADLRRSRRPPAESAYNDVFGGSPKFSAAKPSDYAEIFGGGLASSCNVPFLDLPPVPEDSGGAGFVDYSEVFGGFNGGEFAVDYEELFGERKKAVKSSASSSGRPSVETELFQQDEEVLEFSPGDASNGHRACPLKHKFSSSSNHSDGGSKQFSVSYHTTTGGNMEEVISGETHTAHLHAVPGYTYTVDSYPSLQEVRCNDSPSTQPNNFIPCASKNEQLNDVQEEKIASPTSSADNTKGPDLTMNQRDFGTTFPSSEDGPLNNVKHHSRSSSNHSTSSGDMCYPDITYVGVSDINLRTQPSRVPPPSKLPPNLFSSQENSKTKMNRSSRAGREEGNLRKSTLDHQVHYKVGAPRGQGRHGVAKGTSSFFDGEMDASSAVAAMKEAMEQAQARLKSAKELMERKRENLNNRSRVDDKEHKRYFEKEFKSSEEEKLLGDDMAEGPLSNGDEGMKDSALDGAKKVMVRKSAANHGEKERCVLTTEESQAIRQENEFKSSKMTSKSEEVSGEWKTEEKFYELVNNETGFRVTKEVVKKEDVEKKLKQSIEVNEDVKLCSEEADMPCEFGATKLDRVNESSDGDDYNSKAVNLTWNKEISKAPNIILEARTMQENPIKLDESHGYFHHKGTEKLQSDQEAFICVQELKEQNVEEEASTSVESETNVQSSYDTFKVDVECCESQAAAQTHEYDGLSGTNPTTSPVTSKTRMGETVDKVIQVEDVYLHENSENRSESSSYEQNECTLDAFASANEHEESEKLNRYQQTCMQAGNDLESKGTEDGYEVKQNSEILRPEVGTVQPREFENEMKSEKETNWSGSNEVDTIETQPEGQQIKKAYQMLSEQEHDAKTRVMEGDREDNGKGQLKEVHEKFAVNEGHKISDTAEDVCQRTEIKDSGDFSHAKLSAKKEKMRSQEMTEREREGDKEKARKAEEEKERGREREKDRLAVERATREAHERALAQARERAERIAVEKISADARQRALAESREKAEKAAAEALDKSLAEKALKEAKLREKAAAEALEKALAEKALKEAKLRAERAAAERAMAEARERAVEKALAEKAAADARQRAERLNAMSRDKGRKENESGDCFRTSDKEDREIKLKGRSSDTPHDARFPYTGFSSNSQRNADSYVHGDSESPLRCKARLERHQRTVERAAKALAEKNMRDILAQREQAERNRLADSLDADVRRWSAGKEGNLRALLSTLQYILGPESGWQPVPLTDVITGIAVKKAYRKATLCVHPDKLQQRGANIQQKYICEKVFDLLKDAWNKFNSEER